MKKKSLKMLPFMVVIALALALCPMAAFADDAGDVAAGDVAIQADSGLVPMYRLYNQWSGEHFYTANAGERDGLVKLGWTDEGVGWNAPAKSNTPVYRLYNQYGAEHHYTVNDAERDTLVATGWTDEGTGWYSDDAQAVPLMRDYNPNELANNHNYTACASEHEVLVDAGWTDEGIAWYGAVDDTMMNAFVGEWTMVYLKGEQEYSESVIEKLKAEGFIDTLVLNADFTARYITDEGEDTGVWWPITATTGSATFDGYYSSDLSIENGRLVETDGSGVLIKRARVN